MPANLITCLHAPDRLKSLTHDIRGAEITKGDVGLRLIDSTNRNPVMPMAPFGRTERGPGSQGTMSDSEGPVKSVGGIFRWGRKAVPD